MVMMNRNLIEEEVKDMKSKKQQQLLEQQKLLEQQREHEKQQPLEPELSEDTFTRMHNWYSNNCDYGSVGSESYAQKVRLQDWLEDLVETREI